MYKKLVIIGFIFLVLVTFAACLQDSISEGDEPAAGTNDTTDAAREILENGAMVITFDDGYRTDYEVVYPILKEKDLKAVTYITPIFIEKEMEEYMSWDQVKALKSAGWDVEDHTYSHPPLTELADGEIREELDKVDEAFEERGLEIPEHHAYPHGKFDERVEEIVFEYRDTARKVENGLNSFPLESNTLDSIDMGQHSLNGLKNFVDRAVENNEVAIFFTHDVHKEPFDYGIETDKFRSLVDYAVNETEIEVLTLSELMKLQKKAK